MATASNDGSFKIVSLDGKATYSRHVGHALNTVAITPEPFQAYSDDGYSSLVTCGGDSMTSYTPIVSNSQQNAQNYIMSDSIKEPISSPIWKIRYSLSGNVCYCSDENGVITRYRRINNQLSSPEILHQHKGDVQDIDISPYDECKLKSQNLAAGFRWGKKTILIHNTCAIKLVISSFMAQIQ